VAGIGCHYMAHWIQADSTKTFTQMGGEGITWLGQAPFTTTRHIFTNLGDGTYFHSGILAIRRSVTVPTTWAGNRAVLRGRFLTCAGASDVFVNGRWFAGYGGWAFAPRVDVDVTSALVFGQPNTIEIHNFGSTPGYCANAIQSVVLEETSPPP